MANSLGPSPLQVPPNPPARLRCNGAARLALFIYGILVVLPLRLSLVAVQLLIHTACVALSAREFRSTAAAIAGGGVGALAGVVQGARRTFAVATPRAPTLPTSLPGTPGRESFGMGLSSHQDDGNESHAGTEFLSDVRRLTNLVD